MKILCCFLFFVSMISFFSGVFFLFFPRVLLKFSEVFNTVFEIDKQALKYRIGLGISLFLIGVFLFFMAYYYNVLR